MPELIKGVDVVISANNQGWKNPDISTDTLKAFESIVRGIKCGNTRVVDCRWSLKFICCL